MKSLSALLEQLPPFAWNGLIVILAIIIGLLGKLLLFFFLKRFTRREPGFSIGRSLSVRLEHPLNYFMPLLALDLLLPLTKINARYLPTVDKAIDIVLVLLFAGLLMAVLKVCEDYVYHAYDIHKTDNLRERKIRTQLQFIRRIAFALIIITTCCFILLSFDNLRKLGATMLTGVGIGGIIVGFAAQRSLGNLLAGFQIAFTQPLRIDDVLIVENEWGRVDEITLTYVVLKLWDERNLIIPITYFIEKPFQNWTRVSAEILGTVFLYLDYSVPVDELRNELTRLLDTDPLWDKRVNVLQVTNAGEHTIEIRALMSASDSGKAFDLRCNVREGLINFVRQHYPGAFPLTRAVLDGAAAHNGGQH